MAKPAEAELSVIVVDRHRLFREGVRELLASEGIAVAGEAGDAAEAVSLAAEVKPDVALIDLDLPDASGVDATNRIRLVSPLTRVLVLTAAAGEEEIVLALRSGACGYLLKASAPGEIVAGTRAAAAGQSLLSPGVAAILLEQVRGSPPAADLPDDVAAVLTERELEVLGHLAAGRRNAEIAEALVISEQTVKNHVSSILAKLEVENRIQAAVWAVRRRLV
jgi:DNA-binding NarL/FixJ family response regulator